MFALSRIIVSISKKKIAYKINQKIAALRAEVAQNEKIADLVLIEIKALFAASLAKI